MKAILILPLIISYVQGHARLLDPPSRASMWRVGFDNPADYDDNGRNCGGFNVSINFNQFQSILFRNTFTLYSINIM